MRRSLTGTYLEMQHGIKILHATWIEACSSFMNHRCACLKAHGYLSPKALFKQIQSDYQVRMRIELGIYSIKMMLHRKSH